MKTLDLPEFQQVPRKTTSQSSVNILSAKWNKVHADSTQSFPLASWSTSLWSVSGAKCGAAILRKISARPTHFTLSVYQWIILLFALQLTSFTCVTWACYVYPPDVKDPCKEKECSYGAQCVPSLDGLTARCQCPQRCNRYGDSVGSTPVCGSNGKDYENQCEMRRAACNEMIDIRVKYFGKCGKFYFWMPSKIFIQLTKCLKNQKSTLQLQSGVPVY